MEVAGPSEVRAAVEAAHREHWTVVLAATARVAGDLDLAEDCVQDAYLSALDAWAGGRLPANRAAWLVTAARRRALDSHRRAQVLTRKLPLLLDPADSATDGGVPGVPGWPTDGLPGSDGPAASRDDELRLVFTCCHPALERQAQAALTLRVVCGLPTAEVARVFLVPEATMAARLTRAKKKIAVARIPYRVPSPAELPDRLDAVLTVVHLLTSTAYDAWLSNPALAHETTERCLHLMRSLVRLMPDETEPRGLLALTLLTDARRDARVVDGNLVLLGEQDRRRWDRRCIDEALPLVPGALRGSRTGRFGLLAAIAALHTEAPDAAGTDWAQILALYDRLLTVWPSHVVALNRAVAVAMVHGPHRALIEVDALAAEPRLAGYPYLSATRADLLRRLGRSEEAAAAYRRAVDLTAPGPEQEFLRLREVEVVGTSSDQA